MERRRSEERGLAIHWPWTVETEQFLIGGEPSQSATATAAGRHQSIGQRTVHLERPRAVQPIESTGGAAAGSSRSRRPSAIRRRQVTVALDLVLLWC